MNEIGLLIGGQSLSAGGVATFDRLNPLTNKTVTRAAAATVADARAAVDAAAVAFSEWSDLGPNARRALLLKAADLIQARVEDFVAAMMGEIGSTALWAGFNVKLAADMLREAASMTTQVAGGGISSDKLGSPGPTCCQPGGGGLGVWPLESSIIFRGSAPAPPPSL